MRRWPTIPGVALAVLLALTCRAQQDHGAAGLSLILGRPTGSSVAVSVLVADDADGFVQYGKAAEPCTNRTPAVAFAAGEPRVIALDGLAADTAYRYAFCWRSASSAVFRTSEDHVFHTQRPRGATFEFTVTADSHLDVNTDPALYARTLRGALADRPDFHIDLGDTFMTGKRGNRPADALPQYPAQRYYFGLLCSSAPLFLALGNHDGEMDRTVDAATAMRIRYFPNPLPDAFYSGGTNGNYYAWTWGDALFIVLDPFRYSLAAKHGPESGGWSFSLGRPQYDWLKRTLEANRAGLKFVFIHHLVGGLDRQGRGGAEAARLYEWGGLDPDGGDVFAARRPGWPMPIHALLVKNGVTAVFHGHDHFYARQTVDGLVYQLVPQPGHPGEGSIGQARSYGYAAGELLPGAGYVRVKVAGEKANVEFVRTGADGP